jgi:hypothetical protein
VWSTLWRIISTPVNHRSHTVSHPAGHQLMELVAVTMATTWDGWAFSKNLNSAGKTLFATETETPVTSLPDQIPARK